MHVINKTFGPLSAGTKVDVLQEDEQATVRLITKPSEGLRKQKHPLVTEQMGYSGIFQIPFEFLTECRNRQK